MHILTRKNSCLIMTGTFFGKKCVVVEENVCGVRRDARV